MIYILVFSAVVSFALMMYYESKSDPLKKELTEAIKQHQQPSLFYQFLMRITPEVSEKYNNVKRHLLNIETGPPTNVCVKQLLNICQIDNTPVAFNRCFTLLNRIRFYHKVKQAWCSRAKDKYDKDNERHEQMLMKLWSTLRPGEELGDRMTRKWIDIGFQGMDPATDFRGSGLLGLTQLINLCTRPTTTDKAVEMYRASQKEEQWFFFAVTGINISQKLLNSLNDSKDQVYRVDLDAIILNSQVPVPATEEQMAGLMDHFYRDIFETFTASWVQKKPNIMEFNQFLDDIYGQ